MASTRKRAHGNFDNTSPIILSYPFYTKWSIEKDAPNIILQYFLHESYSPRSLITQTFESLHLDQPIPRYDSNTQGWSRQTLTD